MRLELTVAVILLALSMVLGQWTPQGRFGKRSGIIPLEWMSHITSGDDGIENSVNSLIARPELNDVSVPFFNTKSIFCIRVSSKGLYKCYRRSSFITDIPTR
ncbi:unnamed protein product [Owenia fusiformis]|uniref:Uncharacterized protein n=1 Tax=Owenia fusiformis TaxID=6347 RepID=A0A8J1UCK2_OWEFU|nr:unnamed protein product [Owenia fusiformis]